MVGLDCSCQSIYLPFDLSKAMAQAGKMFDQKSGNGQVSGGDKESAMTSAGETMMKVSFRWSSVPTGYAGTRW